MRYEPASYANLEPDKRDRVPWYWRGIALAASWMILAGYLVLPGLYAREYELRVGQAVLSVLVVALLTAGYSFTALLCFACRNEYFQAEGVFLPALASSTLGLLSIAYNFAASRAFVWGTAAIIGVVLSTTSTFLYGGLLLWTHRRIARLQSGQISRSTAYYRNYLQNMYPTATADNSRSPSRNPHDRTNLPLTEDDRINQQMALLLTKTDPGPSPDSTSATFRIDLPEDREERERFLHSQELVGTPPAAMGAAYTHGRPNSLSEHAAWARYHERGRPPARPSTAEHGSSVPRERPSREERRREIEMGKP